MNELNTQTFLMFNGLAGQSPVTDVVIVFFADYLAYILVAVSVLSFSLWNSVRSLKIKAFISAVVSIILSNVLFVPLIRFFYPHPRPSVTLSVVLELLTEKSLSFPSGHATFFFALSTVLYLYNKKLGVFFLVLSAIMGLARVAAGVHYPLDIVGGAILGACCGFFTHHTVDKFSQRIVI
ncbi:MAG: phosphatase PAP2 family protein [bacterium]|nr:phosphatase PAP2 family protein [bacterium]